MKQKTKAKLKNPKLHIAAALTVAAVSWLAPGDSESYGCAYPEFGPDGQCIMYPYGYDCVPTPFWDAWNCDPV
ncbi:hypothetical protein KK083_19735 [Fulvivirgaceae bacterium PWU4]|uniref:CBM1 domain-containing protein n=1 Tax=Chryseosolibacter histidini TaxID=2782349 RepID=A0AAP2DQ20_9BACT|nr:hypothetical protein [Chryseosolibacter histidini]MBT1699137.1 hypothetical protein [Chryseosolibacter histidini]